VFENLSIGHLAVVMVIVLLLFGAKRIPEIGASLGGGIKAFKKSISDVTDGNTSSIDAAPAPRVASPPPNSTATSVANSEHEGAPKRLLR
jgi:sec-independent protein translocase protein TatA